MSRLPDVAFEELTPEQRRVHDAIASGPRGVVEGPLRVWLASPELAERAQSLGAFCRFGTDLAPRLSELAILVTGAHWRGIRVARARPDWDESGPVPGGDGGDPVRGTPRFDKPDEAAVYAFAQELLERRRVSEATYREAETQLGAKGVVELVGVLGYYGLISMTIIAFEVPVPPNAREPFGT